MTHLRNRHATALERYHAALRAINELKATYKAEDAALGENLNAEYTDQVLREASLEAADKALKDAARALVETCEGIAEQVAGHAFEWEGAVNASGAKQRVEDLQRQLAAAKRELARQRRLVHWLDRFRMEHKRALGLLPWSHFRDIEASPTAAERERAHADTALALMPEPQPSAGHTGPHPAEGASPPTRQPVTFEQYEDLTLGA
jgi:hypothetical protein